MNNIKNKEKFLNSCSKAYTNEFGNISDSINTSKIIINNQLNKEYKNIKNRSL
ncbi:MAG: hypothetical protein LBV51_01010 [Acholeplasmatales bacterium]|nr:hypothetical protein [Acholeplasmatales bacterium]